jgi:hypothetical protein
MGGTGNQALPQGVRNGLDTSLPGCWPELWRQR